MMSLLDVRELTMGAHSSIRGFGNVFMNVDRVNLKEYARIGGPRIGLNLFRGTSNKPKSSYPVATFTLGECSIIELFHYFDLCGDITIGANVVIGGIRSAFFTHTLFKKEFLPICIKDNVYVGSNCLMQMGTTIDSDCVVGLGSVIVKSLDERDALIGGSPAVVVKSRYGYVARDAYELRSLTYYDGGAYVHPGKNPRP